MVIRTMYHFCTPVVCPREGVGWASKPASSLSLPGESFRITSMIQAHNRAWLKYQVRSWSVITSSRGYDDPAFGIVMTMGLQGVE